MTGDELYLRHILDSMGKIELYVATYHLAATASKSANSSRRRP